MPAFAGISLEALAETYGTPLYVYDGDLIGKRIERVLSALSYRPLKVFYSAKANPAVAIAALAREHGLGLDACSPGDLRLAELAGFAESEITYTGFGSTDDELRLAAERAGTLVIDSSDELRRIAAMGVTDSLGLRVNPGIDAGFHAHVMAGSSSAKFGISLGELDAARAEADALGIRVVGLHAHLGSDILDSSAHIGLLRAVGNRARSWGDLEWVNLGGGWGTPRRAGDEEYDWATLDVAVNDELADVSADVELRLEPGGHLIMDAGVVVTRVISVKPPSGGAPSTVVVDTNTNQVISALLFQAHHPVTPLRVADGAAQDVRIVGNLLQAGDVLVPEISFPAVRNGDLILLGHVGAYASCRSGTFNERPRPAEVLVRGGAHDLIRRAETLDELFSRDCQRR